MCVPVFVNFFFCFFRRHYSVSTISTAELAMCIILIWKKNKITSPIGRFFEAVSQLWLLQCCVRYMRTTCSFALSSIKFATQLRKIMIEKFHGARVLYLVTSQGLFVSYILLLDNYQHQPARTPTNSAANRLSSPPRYYPYRCSHTQHPTGLLHYI